MDKPTKEQIQWFWEKCGFTYVFDESQGWLSPDGVWGNDNPPIDLNNLFKYAVPKLVKWIMGNNPNGEIKVIVYTEKNFFKSLDKDPALALFWAIYKAFGGE